ncbi:hypothetical protein [Rhodococcus sp. ARC_M6]|uniref:hypothetical protein n=1 Tax=Rhodococcus sp. ARC_M6 TaxID=2928852 RepID=UPI001FB41AAA|nr:hypothetical protein [Rhodococcus sp. ARC_M6]MCJ0907074.1 hypothetical protein [Rhodococcus sp. ARC_M6]
MTRIPHDARQDLRVVWIALDRHSPAWQRLTQHYPGGIISHRSAARMHQTDDIDADVLEFTCRRRVRINLRDVRIHSGEMERDGWTIVDGLPVTSARRTVADLTAAGIDGGHLATVVRDALSRELVSAPELEKTLATFAFRYGHPPGDGREFLDSLIAQAGVSVNTLFLADAYRRATGAGAD